MTQDPSSIGTAARGVVDGYHRASRRSGSALAEFAEDLERIDRADLSEAECFLVDVTDGLVGLRLRRPEAAQQLSSRLADLVDGPLAEEPELVLHAAVAMLSLVCPEQVRPLARSVLRRPDLAAAARARVLWLVGVADAWSGDLVRGQVGLRESRELARRIDDVALQAETTCLLAKVEALRGDVDAARRHLDEGRLLGAQANSEWVAAGQLECAVTVPLVLGDEDAYVALLEVLVGSGAGVESGLYWEYRWELATARARRGEPAGAERLLVDALPVDPRMPGSAALPAWADWIRDSGGPAGTALESAVDRLTRPVEGLLAARLTWLLGTAAATDGRRADALRLLEASARRYAAIGATGLLVRVEAELRGLRTVPDPPPRRTSGGLIGLTEAERRVAIAVGGGLSNREVAQTLFLSVRTVEWHLATVFRKLGIRNRTELALRQ